jgi:hypothetical protein
VDELCCNNETPDEGITFLSCEMPVGSFAYKNVLVLKVQAFGVLEVVL